MGKFIVLILLSVLLAACSPITAEETLPIEMIAFNSLSDKEQELIPTSPKDSTVTKETISAEIKSKITPTYDEKEVYSVVFNDTAINASGNIIVFVNLDKKTVIGKGFQELN